MVRSPGEDDGIELALQTLRSIANPPDVGPAVADDPDAVADLLLDHVRDIEPRHFVYCLTCLLVGDFDRLCHAHCEAEHLLLATELVAEAAVVQVYVDCVDGRRSKPYASWKHRLVRNVVRAVRAQPEFSLHFDQRDGTLRERRQFHIVRVINSMLDVERHVVWLSWVEQRSIAEIGRIAGMPIEHVEYVLAEALTRAMDGYEIEAPHDHFRDEFDGGEFWRHMEGPDHG